MNYTEFPYNPASQRLKRKSWTDPLGLFRDGYTSQPVSPRDADFRNYVESSRYQDNNKKHYSKSRSTHGTPKHQRKQFGQNRHQSNSLNRSGMLTSINNSNRTSMEALNQPDTRNIIRTFDVNLESPLFFAGDQISGQIVFNLHSRAQLLRLQITFRGALILRSSCHKTGSQTKVDELLNKTELLFDSNLSRSMEMKPGRFIFDVNSSLPSAIPSTNLVMGCAVDKKFKMSIEYYAQAKIELNIPGLQPQEYQKVELKTQKLVFHVEQRSEKDQLLPLCAPLMTANKERIKLRMARNTFKVGDTIAVDVEIENGYAAFGAARLELLQNVSIDTIKHLQTEIVVYQTKEFNWSDRLIYGGDSPRDNAAAKSRYYCRFEMKVDDQTKPSFDLSFCRLVYKLHLQIRYKRKLIIHFDIPITIQRVMHLNAETFRVSPTIQDNSRGIEMDGKIIGDHNPCLPMNSYHTYYSKFENDKNSSTCNMM